MPIFSRAPEKLVYSFSIWIATNRLPSGVRSKSNTPFSKGFCPRALLKSSTDLDRLPVGLGDYHSRAQPGQVGGAAGTNVRNYYTLIGRHA